MLRLCFLACLFVCGPFVQAQTPAPPAQANAPVTTLQASTHVVVLDVVVTDKAGHPVAGLTKENFALREDGKPQTIRSFEAVAAGQPSSESTPHTILLIDEMNTEFTDMAFARYSMDKLLKRGSALSEPTALYVLTNGGIKILANYTRDPLVLDAALKQHAAVLPWRLHRGFWNTVDRINISLTALLQIAAANAGVPSRKNIVWISPGFPIFSPLNLTAANQQKIFEAIRRLSDKLLKARISVYSIDPRGVYGVFNGIAFTNNVQFSAYVDALTRANQAAFGDLAIQTLAVQTGGRALYGRNDVDAEIATTLADAATYYTLSYTPTNRDYDSKFRKVLLTVPGHPEYLIRTRDGYYALPGGASMPQDQVNRELGSAVYSSLTYMAVPIPVIYSRLYSKPDHVSLELQVPASALTWKLNASGGNTAHIEVAAGGIAASGKVETQHVDGFEFDATREELARVQRGQVAFSFKLPIHLPIDHVRVVVRDQESGHIGSAEITHLGAAGGPEPPAALKQR